MHTSRLPNYIRTHRRRIALSQSEIARLLGRQGETDVCRHERFVRQPTLQAAFAYSAMFQVPVEDLFAGMYQEACRLVRARAMRRIMEIERCESAYLTDRRLRVFRRIAVDARH